MNRYQYLVDTYETERLKVLSVWSMFGDDELGVRPHPSDRRGRSVLEQMVHQCVSEDLWFRGILGVDVAAPPLPEEETRMEFIERYATNSAKRIVELRGRDEDWWEETVAFFNVPRSRAWVLVRRVAHTAHHRGQLTAMLRMLNRDLHSNYGPTADTGGLMQNDAPVIYAYPDAEALIAGERGGGQKTPLPGPGENAPTERP
ncbi:MAG: damage-inducible protein DinB [Acidobacteria bacterium]|nr:damage-inducible protein DinB [Acidobacteriota bacterium]